MVVYYWSWDPSAYDCWNHIANFGLAQVRLQMRSFQLPDLNRSRQSTLHVALGCFLFRTIAFLLVGTHTRNSTRMEFEICSPSISHLTLSYSVLFHRSPTQIFTDAMKISANMQNRFIDFIDAEDRHYPLIGQRSIRSDQKDGDDSHSMIVDLILPIGKCAF